MPNDNRDAESRVSLSKKGVMRTAVTLADEAGVASLSMRKIADKLGVKAMSLYHHVANKDEVLDAMVDSVFGEIELPVVGADWKTSMRQRAFSARAALLRHRWAVGLVDSRANPGPATLKHHDAVIGNLRTAGFSVVAAARAFSVLDSYIYGFVLQELNLPFETANELEEAMETILERPPKDLYPHLSEMTAEYALKPDYTYGDEFAFGLELILEGLEQVLEN